MNISDLPLEQQESIELHRIKCLARYEFKRFKGNAYAIGDYLKSRNEPPDSQLRVELRELYKGRK